MKTVLVLDANQRSALAVTRSLGRQNTRVLTSEEMPAALAGVSKYSEQYFTYPSPRLDPEQFISAISDLVKEQHIDILLPMTELTTLLLLRNKKAFPYTTIPFSDIDTVEALSNKNHLMKTAQLLDIPIPQTWYVDNVDNMPYKLSELPYPIVLKPGKSWILHEQKWRRAAVRFADNPEQAKNILETDWAFKAHPFMIQETIDGQGAGVFAIYDNGKPLALFAHRRLREKPPSGGVSVLSESVLVEPGTGLLAQKLLNEANWHGVAMVEFKVATNGTPYLMEINTRFWGSLQLAIDAGVDFPGLLYQLACNERPEPVTEFKIGIKLRWLLGDVDSLYLTLRSSHYSLIDKLAAIRHFIIPSPFRTRYEINRLNDLAPAWFEFKKYIKDLRG